MKVNYISNGFYPDGSLFRSSLIPRAIIPKCFLFRKSLFRTVFIPKGHYSEMFFFSLSFHPKESLFQKIVIPKSRYSKRLGLYSEICNIILKYDFLEYKIYWPTCMASKGELSQLLARLNFSCWFRLTNYGWDEGTGWGYDLYHPRTGILLCYIAFSNLLPPLILSIIANKSLNLPCIFFTGLTWTHYESESIWWVESESKSESVRPESRSTVLESESTEVKFESEPESESTRVESESGLESGLKLGLTHWVRVRVRTRSNTAWCVFFWRGGQTVWGQFFLLGKPPFPPPPVAFIICRGLGSGRGLGGLFLGKSLVLLAGFARSCYPPCWKSS